MLTSMTGFRRYELINGQSMIMVEMKSVNHRYLDLSIKMPKKFKCYEAAIRNLIKNNVQRGKIDVFLSWENEEETNVTLHYNRMLAQEYMDCFQEMKEQFGVADDVSVSMLASFPVVVVMMYIE